MNPFLPPAAFLAALPTFTRRPARPASTLWRSTTGLLRAIRIARRRLVEGQLAGAGGEGRGQLPKYVVVISGTDIENVGGDDVWLEDDDQNEPWESFAKGFSRVRPLSPSCRPEALRDGKQKLTYATTPAGTTLHYSILSYLARSHPSSGRILERGAFCPSSARSGPLVAD